jgi:hypothetical protein
MHMTRNSFATIYLVLVSITLFADVLCGGIIRETITKGNVQYDLALFLVLAVVGVYASDGPPGLRFVRSYSRHKL